MVDSWDIFATSVGVASPEQSYDYPSVSEVTRMDTPDSKVHGVNMGPTWGRQDPGGPMLVTLTLLSGMGTLYH